MPKKSRNSKYPVIVPELSKYWDQRIAEAHQSAAEVSLSEFTDSVLPICPRHGRHTTAYADLSPRQTHDPSQAIVVFMPFANDWSCNAALRISLLQNSLPQPRRIIVFPNNTFNDNSVYILTPTERAVIAGGDFSPLIERQLRVLETLGIKHIQVIGYSQGAAIGAAALCIAAAGAQFTIGPSGLFEPPNVVVRNPRQLVKDFLGARQFAQAVNGSAIPAFSELQHTLGGVDNVRQGWMFCQLGRSAALPDNRALVKGFGHGTFLEDLSAALNFDKKLQVVVGGGTESRILPEEGLRKLDWLAEQYPRRVHSIHIKGYGHELAENLTTYTLLFRHALFPN